MGTVWAQSAQSSSNAGLGLSVRENRKAEGAQPVVARGRVSKTPGQTPVERAEKTRV